MIVHTEQAALVWADRLYHSSAPIPSEETPETALAAYRQIEHRYGSSRASKIGRARCLLRLGRYEEAATLLPPGPQRADTLRRASIVRMLKPILNGRSILQIEPVRGIPAHWVALASRKIDQDGKAAFSQAVVMELVDHPTEVRVVGKQWRIPDQQEGPPFFALATIRLDPNGNPAALVVRRGEGMQYKPLEMRIYRIDPSGLRSPIQFFSEHASRMVVATANRGFRILVSPGYKYDWSDVYEWRRGRFELANERSPELYRRFSDHPEFFRYRHKDRNSSYEEWMDDAALATIRESRSRAIDAWERAARSYRAYVRAGANAPYQVFFYGDAENNYQQILLRIKWLRHGELHHLLLYRPYDFEIQAWPYRLGWSSEIEEKKSEESLRKRK